MKKRDYGWSRREFLKTAGIAGFGAAGLSAVPSLTEPFAAQTEPQHVPTRPFGRSGRKVSILSLGGMFDIPSNQLLLKQAMRWGVTYWDTADCYGGGTSEIGVGKYFQKYPEERSTVFLVTKSDSRSPDGMTRLLDRSLDRMKTDYVDLYFIHGIRNIDELNTETRRWAEKAKAAGKIRLFGFSTHRNMEECLTDGAALGWIDGIMMTYNYRLMHTDSMKRAVDACEAAGIGLTAMKTQGGGSVGTTTESELKLAGRFVERGFSVEQAKLKAVWENPQIASICSQMPNLKILMANISAAVDKASLAATDRQALEQYAAETAPHYCSGCGNLCEKEVAEQIPIADVMRYLMYDRSYGDSDRARQAFAELPESTRLQMASIDYRQAEGQCPQKMAIGNLMREAATLLG